MNAHDAIKRAMESSHMILTQYVSDMSDADLLVRPVPGANHIAWQLGHLICSEHEMIEQMCPGSTPTLPDGFADQHTKETSTSDDAGNFLPKQRYLELYEQQRSATIAALEKLSPEDLDKEAPEKFRSYFPTVGALFTLQASHELMHAGQFAVLRRKLGKPILI